MRPGWLHVKQIEKKIYAAKFLIYSMLNNKKKKKRKKKYSCQPRIKIKIKTKSIRSVYSPIKNNNHGA
jgi:hypothetical protein